MEPSRFIAEIVDPIELHRLSDAELVLVANEVRKNIVSRVSQTGGHFSSNLGTVELTVALYATFSLPPDKVIWDTGHQAYPHKMLTGRVDRFDTLRKHKGLSGFLKRDENPHDVFGAGHAGTAISAALGFAMARDQLGEKYRVAAVTGDSAICAGMSWEALNHAGELQTPLTVILNDNRMSIAPAVGALNNYLSKLRSRPDLQGLARRAKRVVEKMPEPLERFASGLRHSITHMMAPEETGTLFEEMGLEYIGPIDGHDLPLMLDVFRNIRDLDFPVFVHAMTVKGKGYAVAESDSRKWHGVTPFDPETSTMNRSASAVTFTQAFGAAALECAEADPNVVAITAAMPDGTGLTQFAQVRPQQYVDVGIAEQHAVTLAAGMAAGGLKPFCAIYSTFLQRGFDQVLHDVCIQNLPVRFFMDRAGLVGDDGPTHHGSFDLSFLQFIPNLVLIAPRDTTELREMMLWMKDFDQHPSAMRYPRGAADQDLPEARSAIQMGKAERLTEGNDLTIVAVGSMVGPAYRAALELATKGIGAEVINARFIKPFDRDLIGDSIRKTKRLIVVEENARIGGFGQTLQAWLMDEGLGHIPTKVMAIPDRFIEHGPQPVLLADLGLSLEGIVSAAEVLASTKTGNQRPPS